MITVESFHKPCGCRSVGECHHNSFAGLDALDALVDAFAAEMKRKLRRKALEGRSGWDDPACAEGIRAAMLEHAHRGPGQEVDVANLAAMLWNMGSNVEFSGQAADLLPRSSAATQGYACDDKGEKK